jgi:hypothetical protein
MILGGRLLKIVQSLAQNTSNPATEEYLKKVLSG